MERANAVLRDATVQLQEVLMHRLRCEARVEAMENRLAEVHEGRERHRQGRGENAYIYLRILPFDFFAV